MLKRIALTAVLAATAAFVGASIAKATAPQHEIKIGSQVPRGFCIPPHLGC